MSYTNKTALMAVSHKSPGTLGARKCDLIKLVKVPSAPSGVGGPCFVSMVKNVDGTPSAERRCEPGLTCDYAVSVPDGHGVCKRP